MINSLYVVFEALSIIFCLHYLYGKPFKFDILTVVTVLLEVIWMNLIYYQGWNNNWSMMIYVIFLGYSIIRFGFKLKELIVNNISYIVILCVLQAIIIMMVYGLSNAELSVDKLKLWMNLVILLFVILILPKCNLHKLSVILQSKEALIVYSLLVFIISGGLFLIKFKNNAGFSYSDFFVLFVSLILIVISTIDIGKHKIKAKEVETELKMHKLYEASFRNLIEDICARQHEFDNHINAIYNQHILYKDYNELILAQRKYCDSLVKENHYNKLLSKGNPVILGFLYSKFIEAEKEGIDVTYKVVIRNLDNTIPEYKYIEILGNLIKNAIEELTAQEGTKLYVKMIETTEFVLIEVGNEAKGIDYSEIQKFFSRGYSKKGDNRGYGLYNVKRICDEYAIQLQCRYDDNESPMLYFALTINKSL